MSAVTPTREQVFAHPHPEPRSYPLMLRTWTYRPWKPVLGMLILLVSCVLLLPLLSIPILAAALAIQDGGLSMAALDRAMSLEAVNPATMLYLNVSIASWTLAVLLVMRYLHGLRPRWLSSVMPRMRWRFLLACVGLSVIAMVAMIVVGAFLPGDPAGIEGSLNKVTGTTIALGVIILLTTPFQALSEEYVFRGYLMQAFGSLSRSPWVAIIVTSALFAVAHGVQNVPLFVDRFAFGLMAGIVVWRTGGLEAGIAMHVLNNFVAFGFALLLGNISDTLNVTVVSWWNLPLTITQNGVYLILVLWLARRWGLSRTTTPPTPVLESQKASV